MIKLELNKNEIRALKMLLDNSFLTCSYGCIYEEMTESKKDCNECEFTEVIRSIKDKFDHENSSYENEQAILNTI